MLRSLEGFNWKSSSIRILSRRDSKALVSRLFLVRAFDRLNLVSLQVPLLSIFQLFTFVLMFKIIVILLYFCGCLQHRWWASWKYGQATQGGPVPRPVTALWTNCPACAALTCKKFDVLHAQLPYFVLGPWLSFSIFNGGYKFWSVNNIHPVKKRQYILDDIPMA